MGMGRKILLQDGGSRHLLEETDADNEAQLQDGNMARSRRG
jgi:hypothetical protein